MKAGDTLQIKQLDLAKSRNSDGLVPVTFWIFATVLEVLDDGAFVEVNHPANIEHSIRKKVLAADLRTADQVQALHDAHPLAKLEKLSYAKMEHLPLIDYRAALERMKNPELIRA